MEYLLGTADVESLPAGARPGDYARRILEWFPNSYPFTAMLNALKKRERATDSKFSVFETDIPRRVAYAASAYNSSATTILVDDGAASGRARLFRKNSLVLVGTDGRTGEVMRVTEDPTDANSIVVERGFGGSSAASIADNAQLSIVGQAQADGEASPSALYDEPGEIYNYLQIFESPWAVTRRRRTMATRYGEKEEARLKRRAYFQHALDREAAFLYGIRSKATAADADGAERTTTGGIVRFVDSDNVHDGSSTNFTKANWENWIVPLSDYGATEKVVFYGSTAGKAIHQMIDADAHKILEPFETKWGFRMTRMRTAGPDLLLMKHPLLTRMFPGDIIVVDLPMLTFKFFEDFVPQDVVLSNVGQGNKVKKQFYSDCGLMYGCPQAHAYIHGVASFTGA